MGIQPVINLEIELNREEVEQILEIIEGYGSEVTDYNNDIVEGHIEDNGLVFAYGYYERPNEYKGNYRKGFLLSWNPNVMVHEINQKIFNVIDIMEDYRGLSESEGYDAVLFLSARTT